MESDCLVAIQELLKEKDSYCEWGSYFVDIQDRSLEFNFCHFKHVNKSANGLAHSLAKYSCDVGVHKIWRNSLPLYMCNPDVY